MPLISARACFSFSDLHRLTPLPVLSERTSLSSLHVSSSSWEGSRGSCVCVRGSSLPKRADPPRWCHCRGKKWHPLSPRPSALSSYFWSTRSVVQKSHIVLLMTALFFERKHCGRQLAFKCSHVAVTDVLQCVERSVRVVLLCSACFSSIIYIYIFLLLALYAYEAQ